MSDQDSNPKQTGHTPKYKVAPFSGVVGCGVFQSDFIAVIVPPSLPENLWEESAKVHALTRRKKYATEIKQETERVAIIVCDALNSHATLAEENAQLRKALDSLNGLFSDGSPFYIAKVGNRITNGDQDVIDKAFMLAKAALEQK